MGVLFPRVPNGNLRYLMRILMHRPEMMLGMLEVILCGNPVACQGFGASLRQIAFVVPLCVLWNALLAGNPCCLSDLRSSRPHVALPIWTRPCGHVFGFR